MIATPRIRLGRAGWEWRLWKRHQFRALKRRPRYQPFVTHLLGRPLQVVDGLSFYHSYREIFQQEIYRFDTHHPAPRILDGGANIGLSVLYFKQLYPLAKITAFEPDDAVFRALKENLHSFQHPDVELVEAALWTAETTLSFYAEGADAGRVHYQHDGALPRQVPAVRLASYLQQEVDMVKLDIEGAEVDVLVDCGAALQGVRHLFVEYHSFQDQPQRLDEMLTVLREAGFRVQIHAQFASPSPLLQKARQSHLGMDLQLNVFAYRS
jgi:FkbM family methyltransferase